MTEQKQPEELTTERLQELIDEGKVTVAQALDYVTNQRSTKAIDEALNRFRAEQKQTETLNAHKEVITRYQKVIPALLDENSDEHKQVAATYKRLIGEGYPDHPSTERVALLETFGKVANIEKAKQGRPESFKEGASGAGGGDNDSASDEGGDGPPRGMAPRVRAHYEKMLRAGGGPVKTWKDVADLEKRRGKPALRAKYG